MSYGKSIVARTQMNQNPTGDRATASYCESIVARNLMNHISGLCGLIRDSTAPNQRRMRPEFVPTSGLGVTIQPGPRGRCRDHGNLSEKCRRSLAYFSPKQTFRVWTWAIPSFDTLVVEAGVILVCGVVNGAGCGGGLPRIAYSQKLALESANASRRNQNARVRFFNGPPGPSLVLRDPGHPSGRICTPRNKPNRD